MEYNALVFIIVFTSPLYPVSRYSMRVKRDVNYDLERPSIDDTIARYVHNEMFLISFDGEDSCGIKIYKHSLYYYSLARYVTSIIL